MCGGTVTVQRGQATKQDIGQRVFSNGRSQTVLVCLVCRQTKAGIIGRVVVEGERTEKLLKIIAGVVVG